MEPLRVRALEDWLAGMAEARRAAVDTAELLSGGAIQENWALDVAFEGGPWDGLQRLVVRTDSPSAVQVSLSRREEYALLRAAFAAGVTVPEPLWLCEAEAVLGKPFFVMRRVEGVAAGHKVVRDPELGGGRAALARRLGGEMARIHTIVPPRADLAFLPVPDEAPALDRVRAYRRFLDLDPRPRPVLELALRWLEINAPPPGSLVLCHRDFRTGNYMVDRSGVTGILDWEFAGWGDPHEDIGWFCARCWRFGAEDREAGGVGSRDDFHGGYEAVAGRVIDRPMVPYWEVMATVRWAVIALQQADRHVSGRERNLELALTGHMVPELELQILDQIEALS